MLLGPGEYVGHVSCVVDVVKSFFTAVVAFSSLVPGEFYRKYPGENVCEQCVDTSAGTTAVSVASGRWLLSSPGLSFTIM